MRIRPALVYKILAAVFALFGILTFLSIAQDWPLDLAQDWRAVAYLCIDLLAAYGFYHRASWLLSLFGINTGASLLLLIIKGSQGADVTLLGAVVVLNALITYYLYRHQKHARMVVSPYLGAVGSLLLIATYCYGFAGLLS